MVAGPSWRLMHLVLQCEHLPRVPVLEAKRGLEHQVPQVDRERLRRGILAVVREEVLCLNNKCGLRVKKRNQDFINFH
jgi:hypothetical protein